MSPASGPSLRGPLDLKETYYDEACLLSVVELLVKTVTYDKFVIQKGLTRHATFPDDLILS